jgi:hypothetical protein
VRRIGNVTTATFLAHWYCEGESVGDRGLMHSSTPGWLIPWVRVVDDGGRGRGLQSLRHFSTDDVVIIYSGERTASPQTSDYVVHMGGRNFVDCANSAHLAQLVNDAAGSTARANLRMCRPTCSTSTHSSLRATTPIRPGDMLYTDYGDAYWTDARVSSIGDVAARGALAADLAARRARSDQSSASSSAPSPIGDPDYVDGAE